MARPRGRLVAVFVAAGAVLAAGGAILASRQAIREWWLIRELDAAGTLEESMRLAEQLSPKGRARAIPALLHALEAQGEDWLQSEMYSSTSDTALSDCRFLVRTCGAAAVSPLAERLSSGAHGWMARIIIDEVLELEPRNPAIDLALIRQLSETDEMARGDALLRLASRPVAPVPELVKALRAVLAGPRGEPRQRAALLLFQLRIDLPAAAAVLDAEEVLGPREAPEGVPTWGPLETPGEALVSRNQAPPLEGMTELL